MTIRNLEPDDLTAVCEIIRRHWACDETHARHALEREFAERQIGLIRGKHIVAAFQR